MLAAAAILLGLSLITLLIINPLEAAFKTRQALYLEKRLTLAWMQQAKPRIRQAHPPKILNSTKLLAELSKALKASSLKHFNYHLEQTGSGDIELSFDAVPYTVIMPWLQEQSHHYQLEVKRLSVDKTATSGLVKLSFVFGFRI